jgi:glutathione S-transferase
VKEVLPKYLRWLQKQLEDHGGEYFADNRLTIADLKAFGVLRWLGSGALDHIPTSLVDDVAPKLTAYMNRIAALPAIAGYYAARG